MYKLINEILEKSKETGKDIGVAYDLLRNERGQDAEFAKASEFLEKNQIAILKLRAADKANEIKKLCEMSDDSEAVKKQIRDLYNRGIIR